ncbi:DUF6134 family protein [Pedobacter sp. KR3-3]|uniref:DUF6134 family protein n=1 Tax=Pedobacter albus TaxID=3113905 RepID=A0ABU7I5V0_9SPHI|nr:DUF6134 family protein [Pedobacter sp. KR3-3]MEE1944749.1 DUF6134 family protein [Pedobacter sp. KR3-3]
MIPALLFWLFKRYARPTFHQLYLQLSTGNLLRFTKKKTILVLFVASSLLARAEEKTATYQIKRNGTVIGQMQLQQKQNGAETFLKMSSKVKTRFVFEINVQTADESLFKNGQLQYSSVYRKVNGKEKENRQTKLLQQNYQLLAGNKSSLFNSNINYNMMLLYCQEPIHISQVYSDNFQQMLAIKKIGMNNYRIDLPDGNYNTYYFQNGICKTVEVHHSLYTITMELV